MGLGLCQYYLHRLFNVFSFYEEFDNSKSTLSLFNNMAAFHPAQWKQLILTFQHLNFRGQFIKWAALNKKTPKSEQT